MGRQAAKMDLCETCGNWSVCPIEPVAPVLLCIEYRELGDLAVSREGARWMDVGEDDDGGIVVLDLGAVGVGE